MVKKIARTQNIFFSAVALMAFLVSPFGAQAIVVEESNPHAEEIVKANPSTACVYFLDEYLHPTNSVNHQWEVKKLQMFLNAFIDADIDVNGDFDVATEAAAREFQLRYNDQILMPWVQAGFGGDIGPFEPTGYVYITTRHMINELLCVNDNIPLPSLNPDDNVLNGTID